MHFCVLVIRDENESLEDIMAPYDENLEVEPYIYRTKEKIIEESKERKKRFLADIASGKNFDDEWHQKYLNAETDEDFYNAEIHHDMTLDEDGNEMTTYNPNSKFDYYSEGGRWDNALIDDNYCRVKDYSLDPTVEELREAKHFWEVRVEGIVEDDSEESKFTNPMYNRQYYIDKYGTKENYIYQSTLNIPFAFVYKGKWYEKGEVGWFSTGETKDSIAEFTEFFIKTIKDPENQNKIVQSLDCHI